MAISGMQMMLKSLIPEETMGQIEGVGNFVKEKIAAMEAAQIRMEKKLDAIMRDLDVEFDG